MGRDVPVVAPLAADLVDQLGSSPPSASDALVCPAAAWTPANPNNWRAQVFNPAAEGSCVGWATPCSGRHTYISLQIHAGLSPVTVAAYAGNSPENIWRRYAREFERSRTAGVAPLEVVLQGARREIANLRVPEVFPEFDVVELGARRSGRKNAV